MTTLVTGGTGFLGRHLVKKLLARNEHVRILSRRIDLELADLGAEFTEGSINRAQDILRAVDGVTRVYHLAGRVERDPENAHVMYDLHVEGTRRLLDALREQSIERIVYASTSGTVGVSKNPDFVADHLSPTAEHVVKKWPYYLSKIYAERVVERFVRKYNMPIVTMRPTLLLGPEDLKASSTGDIVLFMRKKIPAAINGGLSYVDVRDAADAFILGMDNGTNGSSYLLGACNLTLEDFFKRLQHITGIRAPWIPLPGKSVLAGAKLLDGALRFVGRRASVDPISVDMAQHFWYIDSSHTRKELGWTPRPDGDTLRDTVRWIEKHHPEFNTKNSPRFIAPNTPYVPSETIDFAKKLRES